MNSIQDIVDSIHRITGENVYDRRRKREVVEARMLFSYVLRQMGYSYESIGAVLKKDHSTIMHYIEKLGALSKNEPIIKDKLQRCIHVILNTDMTFDAKTDMDYKSELKRLSIQIDALKAQINSVTEEKKDLIAKYSFSNDKRLGSIYRLIEENTKHGHELLVERRIIKMFNEMKNSIG